MYPRVKPNSAKFKVNDHAKGTVHLRKRALNVSTKAAGSLDAEILVLRWASEALLRVEYRFPREMKWQRETRAIKLAMK